MLPNCLETQAKPAERGGGGVQFIAGICAAWWCATHVAHLHGSRRMVKLHHTCSCHVAILSATRPLRQIFLNSRACTVFRPNFWGSFWRPYGAQNGSCRIPLEILRSLLSKDIKFAQIGVQTEKLWLPEVQSFKLFFCVFSAKIPAKRGMLPANWELRLVARVAIFLTYPRLQINSQWVGRNPHTTAVVWEEKRVRFSTCFPYFHLFLCTWLM